MIICEQSFSKMTIFLINDWDSFLIAIRSLAPPHSEGQG